MKNEIAPEDGGKMTKPYAMAWNATAGAVRVDGEEDVQITGNFFHHSLKC